jgi:heme/copper-type cytochrome/quinol oxidase subunit 1
LILLGISTTVGAINFVVTLMRTRAPGMSINRLPILVWGTLTASVANLLAVPRSAWRVSCCGWTVTSARISLRSEQGGQPMLWQHLFWMFGHPWVYAVVLPALGIVSDGLPTFCRRPLVGYTAVALATVVDHDFWFRRLAAPHVRDRAAGSLSLAFFSAASMIIAIPSAVSVFAWIATIWTGRPVLTTAFLFFASFIFLFVSAACPA